MQRPESIAAKRKHRKHVLVCAPSNSALDEIVLRLLNTGRSILLDFVLSYLELCGLSEDVFVFVLN